MLQKTHVETYEVVKKFISENGFSPTINEIASKRRLSPTATYKHVLKLIEAKMLKRQVGKTRTLMPVK